MNSAYTIAVMLIVSPAVGIAAGPPAHLSTTGTVRTNSSLLPSGSNIYAGDVIATDADGLAIVTSQTFGRLEVRPSSRVQFAEDQVALRDGAVAGNRLAVVLGEYKIHPRSRELPDNWFAVASRNGRKVVAAHRGDVLIARAGAAPVLVPAGFYAVADQAPTEDSEESGCPDTESEGEGEQPGSERKDKDDKDDRCAGAVFGKTGGKETAKEAAKTAGKTTGQKTAEAAAKTAGWTIGSLSHAASVAVVTTVAAAAATATTVGIALSDEPVSPSQ